VPTATVRRWCSTSRSMNVSISQLGRGLRHHRHDHPGGHHPLLPGDGDVHAHRREDRRHHRPAPGLRHRPDHLRLRLGADRRRAHRPGARPRAGRSSRASAPRWCCRRSSRSSPATSRASLAQGAYAVIGGVAGAGIAIGPILGGWATTELSWRIVFVGEVVLVVGILAMTGHRRRPASRRGTRLDVVGTVLSAIRARAHRARHPAVVHVGRRAAEGLARRAVRVLADALRDRRRA
jgi:hypothetical protein